jgi:hypothetical protein
MRDRRSNGSTTTPATTAIPAIPGGHNGGGD